MSPVRYITMERAENGGWAVTFERDDKQGPALQGAFTTYAEAVAFIAVLVVPAPAEAPPFFAMSE